MAHTTQATVSDGTGNEHPTVSSGLKRLNEYFGFLEREDVEHVVRGEGTFAIRSKMVGGAPMFFLVVRLATGNCEHIQLVPDDPQSLRPKWSLSGLTRPVDVSSQSIRKLLDELCKHGSICTLEHPEPIKLVKPADRTDEMFRNNEVQEDRKLGEGNFCFVTKGWISLKNGAKRPVAVKAFKESIPGTSTAQIANEQKVLRMEFRILSAIKHPNVIGYYGAVCDVSPLKIVMEFCGGGSLLDHLRQYAKFLTDGERLLYAFETSRGMSYLEQKGIIHRDLAARNCLIGTDSTLKIGDFGLSISTKDAQTEIVTGKFRFPIRHMAPETIGRRPRFSHQSDVWAYGMLIFEIFSGGQNAWPDADAKAIAHAVKKRDLPQMPPNTPSEVVHLVAGCWKMDPKDRLKFHEIAKTTRKLVKDPRFAPPLPRDRTLALAMEVIMRAKDDFNLEPKTGKVRPSLFSSRNPESEGPTGTTKAHHRTGKSFGNIKSWLGHGLSVNRSSADGGPRVKPVGGNKTRRRTRRKSTMNDH